MDKTYRLAGIVLILMVLVCGVVFGDGKAFPTLAVKVAPDIPSQRAVLAYRDGVETLIIESAFDGDGKEFGWVIPLPNVPTEFEAASAGFIEVLSSETQPYVRDYARFWVMSIVIITVGLWFLVVVALKVKHRFSSLTLFIIIGFMGFGVFFVTLVSKSISGVDSFGGGDSSVKVLKTEEVGSYGLAVLDAENSEGLNEWLTTNGFVGLNEQERKVISDYINEGWCFVAAKLKRDNEGYSVPHPLSMKFESAKAVYPMRLTGTVGSNVYLELFVIADKGAVVEGMTLEFADGFEKELYGYRRDLKDRVIKREVFAGNHYGGLRIGHPASFNVMWDTCFVTRLCGEIEPMHMDTDIVVQFEDIDAGFKDYFTSLYVAGYAYKLGSYCLSVIIIIGVFVFHKRLIEDRGRRFALTLILLPAIVVGCMVGGVTYVAMEKVEAKVDETNPFGFGYHRLDYMSLMYLAAGDGGFEGMTKEDVTSVFETALLSYEDKYKEKAIEFGDGLWDIEILEDERGIVFRTYMPSGFPVDYVLSDYKEWEKNNKAWVENILRVYK